MTRTEYTDEPANPGQVSVDNDSEMRSWCHDFGCTAEQLKAAVRAVGVGAGNVRKYLASSLGTSLETSPHADLVTLLLIQGNPLDAEPTIRALTKNESFKPLHWVKGDQEALDFLHSQGAYVNRKGVPLPKLILLDTKLPKISDLEVLRRIKADPHLRTVPVVIVTPSSEPSDIADAYRLGASEYVVKPLEFTAFVEKIEQVGMYWINKDRGSINEDSVTNSGQLYARQDDVLGVSGHRDGE